jgi:hypothetical protein
MAHQILLYGQAFITKHLPVTTNIQFCAKNHFQHDFFRVGAGAFGYPDKTYISRVKEELAAVGVQ